MMPTFTTYTYIKQSQTNFMLTISDAKEMCYYKNRPK